MSAPEYKIMYNKNMSELLRDDSELMEDDSDFNIVGFAVDSLSHIIEERMSSDAGEDTYNGWGDDLDDGLDEDWDDDLDDDDMYYSEDEEQDWGTERVDFNEEKLVLQEIDLPDEIIERFDFLDKLPHGVAVMGGVARSIAREVITGEREPMRDIDLVNIVDEEGKSEVSSETLRRLAQDFMPDDYAFGHGVNSETLEHYFKTRDFTINQSLIMDGKLIISNFAYNDFQENIIRPTYYEHPYSGNDVGSRLFLKALMMRDVVSQISSSIPLIEDLPEPEMISDFDVALFLNKAMSRGAKTARLFTKDLAEWNVIGQEYAEKPVALAKLLLENVYNFDFRPSADPRFIDVEECDDMDGYFVPESMLRYHAADPEIRRAIAEYGDNPVNMEERKVGFYTQAEYDEINGKKK